MTKGELEKEAEDKGIKYSDSLEFGIPKFSDEEGYCWSQVEQAYEKGALDFAEPREKRIAELEEKISILLSCQNCPENKGGYLCQKEYEGKCLAQKAQYINELKKENAELDCQKNRNKSCYSCANATKRCFRNEIGCPCQKYKSYKEENVELKKCNGELAGQKASLERWFGEAKNLIKDLLGCLYSVGYDRLSDLEKAERFLGDLKE